MVQSCTADEAAAMVAAIRAFEQRGSGARPPVPTAPKAGAGPAPGTGSAARKDGAGVRWTRSESSLGRGF